jgi:transposase-like protein
VCYETVRFWWNRFGPLFAADIRRQRVSRMDEVYVKINGEMHYLWRAVDQDGEVLESYVTRFRDKAAALTFLKKALKRHGSPEAITTDGLRSYRAAMNELGNAAKQEIGRWPTTESKTTTCLSSDESGHAQVPTDEVIAEVRFSPRQPAQPLRLGTPSH